MGKLRQCAGTGMLASVDNKLHFKCVFMDHKRYLILISDNFSKTSAKKFFQKVIFFRYISIPSQLTPNTGVSWNSWYFLLKIGLLGHTCIFAFVHLPFLRQHIRAPVCKKTKRICPWESELWPNGDVSVPTYPALPYMYCYVHVIVFWDNQYTYKLHYWSFNRCKYLRPRISHLRQWNTENRKRKHMDAVSVCDGKTFTRKTYPRKNQPNLGIMKLIIR